MGLRDKHTGTAYDEAWRKGLLEMTQHSTVHRVVFILVFVVALLVFGLSRAQAQAISTFERTFYVPLMENELFDSMKTIHSAIAPPLRGQVNIVPSVTNTVIIYDHWEDDFEDDINNPTQSTTQIWGDGNLTNGVLPGYPTDINVAGGTVILTNEVPIPRIATNLLFDAGDKIKANLPVNVSRVILEQVTGEALSGAVNVYPIENFGLEIVAPIGTNTQTDQQFTQVSDMFIMSSRDGNIVDIDKDGDGTFEETELLEEGEGYKLEGVSASGRVRADYPIQGHLVTGGATADKQMRWITLVPDLFWDTEFLVPVAEVKNEEYALYLYNDSLNAITTRYETLFETNLLVINPRGVTNYFPADDTGIRFTSLDTNEFQVLGIHDYGAGSYDWGFGVYPASILTEMILVGYGPGSSDGSRNANPIWFTPKSNSTAYIDFDADPLTGAFIDPQGNRYDVSVAVTPLNVYRVYDASDNDQTALRIYTLDTTELVGAWGSDVDVASAGYPYLDMGYSIFPLPTLAPTKSAGLYADNDGDGSITPGDEIEYTITVTRIGFDVGDGDVVLTDEGPQNATYTNGTTYLSGTNLSDSIVPPGTTYFPLDETGTNIGFLGLGETVVVTYRALVPDPFPADQSGLINCVDANGNRVCLFTPINQGGQITGKVLSDTDGDGDTTDPDPGVEGVTVYLYTDPNCDGDYSDGTRVATGVTASTGGYFFNVETGCYVIVEIDFADWYSTGDSDGANDNQIAVTLTPGDTSSKNNFLDALAGFQIEKTSEPGGIWFPLQEVTYTITINNTGLLDQAGVWVYDYQSNGLSSVAGSAQVTYETRATNNFIDYFDAVAYTNNDGTDDWYNDWTEVNDDGSPTPGIGSIGIFSNRLYMIGDSPAPANMWITRAAELSGLGQAGLSFTFGSSVANDNPDQVDLQVSTDLVSWVTLDSFNGYVSGFTNYNLTPYISAQTYIRFFQNVGLDRADEYFWFDDVTIQATEVSSVSATASVPGLMITNYTILADGGMLTLTYTSVVGLTDSWVTNTACFASDVQTTPVCADVVNFVDTSALPFRISGRVLNDIDGDADPGDLDDGIQGALINVWTDPNGDGDPSDGVAVRTNYTDASGYYLAGNLVPGDYVVVETDPGAYQSTGDVDGPNDNRVAVTIDGSSDIFDINFWDWTISGLEIQKLSSEEGDIDFGENVSYMVIITNTRASAQGGLEVIDTLPSELSYLAGSSMMTSFAPFVSDLWRDEFNTISYTNNSGTVDFTTDWSETGDDGSPAGGDVYITGDSGDTRLRIKDDDNSISRMVDLVQYGTATLSFAYRRAGLDSDAEYAAIEISTNPAVGWTELDRYANGTDVSYISTNFDITPYISTSTWIRFITPPGGMGNTDGAYFDDVEISAAYGGTTTSTAGPPASLQTGYTIAGGEVLVFTFDASVGSGDEVINVACFTTISDTNGLCASVTNGIGEILLTQGVVVVEGTVGAVQMAWTAGTNYLGEVDKDYDLLYVDRSDSGFHASLSDEWVKVATVFDSSYTDEGSEPERCAPSELGDAFRFYRSARRDRWIITNETRYASRQIYVAKNLNVVHGENWCSLVGIPHVNTMLDVFGTNQLPAGDFYDEATRIEWYGATQNAAATNILWLANPGIWMHATGGVANSMSVPVGEAFNVIIPTNAPATNYALTVVGLLPTNATVQGGQIQAMQSDGIYNIASYAYPYWCELEDSGLRESGFTGAPAGQEVNPNNSDEIRIMQRGDGSLGAPKARILMNSTGQFVFWTGGTRGTSAEKYKLDPDDAIIIYTRASTSDWNWVQPVPYAIPTPFMSP